MPEDGGSNIEVAQLLSERKESSPPLEHAILGIAEADFASFDIQTLRDSGNHYISSDPSRHWEPQRLVRPYETLEIGRAHV